MHLGSGCWLTHYFYAYTVGPLLGGLLAGIVYLILARHIPDQDEPCQTASTETSEADTNDAQPSSDNPICFNDGVDGSQTPKIDRSRGSYQGPSVVSPSPNTSSAMRCDINDNSI